MGELKGRKAAKKRAVGGQHADGADADDAGRARAESSFMPSTTTLVAAAVSVRKTRVRRDSRTSMALHDAAPFSCKSSEQLVRCAGR